MSRYQAAIDVPLGIERAFDLWTDAGRFPQWQTGVLRVFEPSGPPRLSGTTMRLEMGPRMTRAATILESEPPVRHVVRQSGLGSTDELTATFETLDPGRTRVSVEVNLAVGLGALGRVMERLTYGQTGKQLRTELDRFAELAARSTPALSPGSIVTVDCGAGFRVAKVIDVKQGCVHLALMPGVSSQRSSDVEAFLDNESRLLDPLALKPLQMGLKRAASTVVRGQPLLGLDGGVGVPHVALTAGAFADGLPGVAGMIEVFPDEASEVERWRAANGPVLGEDLDAAITPIVSLKAADGYRAAKILHVDRNAVHVRLYSDQWDIPPDHIDPWALRLDRADAPSPGVGHMPVSHRSFGAWEPAFERLAMVGSSERDGYRYWLDAGGGVFDAPLP